MGMAKQDLAKTVARAKAVVAEIEKLSADRKKLYEEHEELVAALEREPSLETHGLRIVDAFAKSNTAWGHGPVRRFSLEIVPCARRPTASGETREESAPRR
jgi:hypothetical protein